MRETLSFLTYNGRRSLDYGLMVTGKTAFNGAQRDVTVVQVPGRDGDLIIDNGRYKNVPIKYDLAIVPGMAPFGFAELAQIIKDWLLPGTGYYQLWDTYDPRYYRLGAYTGNVDIEQELTSLGSCSLSFDCKPFRYSVAGQQAITLTSAGALYNGEAYASKPYIKVTGSGDITLTINGTDYELEDVDAYIELDSELMNAYKGAINQNSKMTSVDFPKLVPGLNSISWTGTVTSVSIVPRWCCL